MPVTASMVPGPLDDHATLLFDSSAMPDTSAVNGTVLPVVTFTVISRGLTRTSAPGFGARIFGHSRKRKPPRTAITTNQNQPSHRAQYAPSDSRTVAVPKRAPSGLVAVSTT